MSSDEHQVPLEAEESGAQTVEPETAATRNSEDPAAPIQPEAQAGSPSHSIPLSDADVERQISRMSRRSLLWGAAAVATGLAGQQWLITRRDDDGIPWPFRRALEINEELARDYFKPSRLAPVFPRALAGTPRENGDLGLSDDFDPATWRLTVVRGAGKGGAETPDGGYYVGLDMESALHPQTLLCYEMNGQPLTLAHGAPLRLVIPVKYGIKNIKRIGTIRFTNQRPADYWAEQGYDWYSGH